MNNINILKKFLSNKDKKKLLLNQIDEKIDQFYYYLINYYANKSHYALKVVENENANLYMIDDLFGKSELTFYKKIQSKKIDIMLNSNEKSIFLVEYKYFKKFNDKLNTINTYNYKKDIEIFLKDELKIHDQLLFNNIANNPEYVYSEIEKFLVNNKYENSVFNENLIDSFLNNRKDLYEIKNKPSTNLVEFYNLLKKEVNIKKFSFLIS